MLVVLNYGLLGVLHKYPRMLINFNLRLWVAWWEKKEGKTEGCSEKTLLTF